MLHIIYHVANAIGRFYERFLKRPVDLVAYVLNVDVNGIVPSFFVCVPRMINDIGSAYCFAAVANQEFKDIKLFAPQRDGYAGPDYLAPAGVNNEIMDL